LPLQKDVGERRFECRDGIHQPLVVRRPLRRARRRREAALGEPIYEMHTDRGGLEYHGVAIAQGGDEAVRVYAQRRWLLVLARRQIEHLALVGGAQLLEQERDAPGARVRRVIECD
jgi:hypothetical protein